MKKNIFILIILAGLGISLYSIYSVYAVSRVVTIGDTTIKNFGRATTTIRNFGRATTTISADAYSAAIHKLNPVVYWRLNEKNGTIVKDEGLFDITGTMLQSPNLNQTSFFTRTNKTAIKFDSSSPPDAVSFGFRPELDLSTFSIAVWVKAANLTNYSAIVYHMNDASGNGWGLQIVSSTGLVELCTVNCVRTTSAIVAGTNWYFIVGTLTGTTGKIYFNGSLEATNGSQTAPTYSSEMRTWIGRRNGSELNFLSNDNLTIDEVAIFNYVLSGPQITTLYNTGIGSY